jgi:hypothetical protein
MNKVLPEEMGNCDCCCDSSVKINICPSNNKCEYSMCDKCITNLENKTKTNKCPACREEIITINHIGLEEYDDEESDDEESENLEIRRNVMTWTGKFCCCECAFVSESPNFYTFYCKLLQHICCCLYNSFEKNHGPKKALSYSVFIHIFCIFIGRIMYYEFYDEKEIDFFCVWYLFIGKAAIGFAILICITVSGAFVLGCLYDCCCNDRDD